MIKTITCKVTRDFNLNYYIYEAVHTLIISARMVAAIKLVRGELALGLADAKAIVDEIKRQSEQSF